MATTLTIITSLMVSTAKATTATTTTEVGVPTTAREDVDVVEWQEDIPLPKEKGIKTLFPLRLLRLEPKNSKNSKDRRNPKRRIRGKRSSKERTPFLRVMAANRVTTMICTASSSAAMTATVRTATVRTATVRTATVRTAAQNIASTFHHQHVSPDRLHLHLCRL
jgi:hypothetical protein